MQQGELPYLERMPYFLWVILNPAKSLIPWAIGGVILYHLYLAVKEKLEDAGILYVEAYRDISRDELIDKILGLKKSERKLKEERRKLQKGLKKCIAKMKANR